MAAEPGGKSGSADQGMIARKCLDQHYSRMAAGYTEGSRSVARCDSSADVDWKDVAEFRYVRLGTLERDCGFRSGESIDPVSIRQVSE